MTSRSRRKPAAVSADTAPDLLTPVETVTEAPAVEAAEPQDADVPAVEGDPAEPAEQPADEPEPEPEPEPVPYTYRSIPTTIRAVQFTGDNADEIVDQLIDDDTPPTEISVRYFRGEFVSGTIHNHTTESDIPIHLGDWIIRGTVGELYPCPPDVFTARYEQVTA